MVKDDEEDGNRSKPFYIRSKASILRSSPRLIPWGELSFVELRLQGE